ncbi:LUD domain-containing protein [Desulforhopalus vacuolatus]|uniref:LutC/YkgG family protein n=1 Tax=Desulforhopalus vacuolatus TaxID=40414 RepID=UPI0019658550|nr:LUD domain-containing protein [Desulforhopalus vacuolatus]MBM9520013.1 LUD domain-containing protein [Desulforhopalus vacuolatus]
MAERTAFLKKIAIATGQDGETLRDPADFPAIFASEDQDALAAKTHRRSHEELLQLASLFEDVAKTLNLTCYRAASFKKAQKIIVKILKETEPEFSSEKIVMVHDHPDLVALNLPEVLQKKKITSYSTARGEKDIRARSEKALAGITAPELAMAAGAAIVQRDLPGQPRSTSLLPSIHIALLRLENIVADYDEFYARLGKYSEEAMVFISGPSKTADIEAVLVHGAHGPRALHCIILDEVE